MGPSKGGILFIVLKVSKNCQCSNKPHQIIAYIIYGWSQSVLRTEANNLNAWEGLADSYFNRGSYTSALKAYDKVLQLQKAWTSLCFYGLF